VKLLLPLIVALTLSACAPQAVPKGGDPVSPPAVAAVSLRELGEALAKRVESGDPMTTQHVYRLAEIALKDAGLSIDLGPVPDNKPLDDDSRKEWAAKFRGWR